MDYGNENGRREGILLLITIKLDANVLLKWKNLTGDLLMKGTIISMRYVLSLNVYQNNWVDNGNWFQSLLSTDCTDDTFPFSIFLVKGDMTKLYPLNIGNVNLTWNFKFINEFRRMFSLNIYSPKRVTQKKQPGKRKTTIIMITALRLNAEGLKFT